MSKPLSRKRKRLTGSLRLRKKQRTGNLGERSRNFSIFGSSIDAIMAKQCKHYPNATIPIILHNTITYLREHLIEEGLFRISGKHDEIQRFQMLYATGSQVDLNSMHKNPHIISSLLKTWLLSLEDPLLTAELYKDFVTISTKIDISNEQRCALIRFTLDKLPRYNLHSFLLILNLLHQVQQQSETNAMTPKNLAIVVGPALLWAPKGPVMEMKNKSAALRSPIISQSTMNIREMHNSLQSVVALLTFMIENYDALVPEEEFAQIVVPEKQPTAQTGQSAYRSTSLESLFNKENAAVNSNVASPLPGKSMLRPKRVTARKSPFRMASCRKMVSKKHHV
eukprot:TRINITY_DN20079_c0_g1_i1.p1 TRINITY_DN20079_c0_g1~~TRINITY_DN20079_c0_g1_i1.p1  ORF type:complete len:338 (+),score=26.32 TRINITY_DN20079_c0_g1_i1:27-1040(+)